MTLKPVRKTAHPSGVGDVVSVEQLSGSVAFVNDALSAVGKEHIPGPHEARIHRNPQFAIAAAHLLFELDDQAMPRWERRVWSEGFHVDPYIRARVSRVKIPITGTIRMVSLSVEWELPEARDQWPEIGYCNNSPMTPTREVGSFEFTQDGRAGSLRFGMYYQQETEGGPIQTDDDIEGLCGFYLMIRTRPE